MVIGERVGVTRRGCQVGRGKHLHVAVSTLGYAPIAGRLPDRTRTKEFRARVFLAHEGVEYPVVAPERRRVIALGRATHGSERRLVEIL